MKEKFLNVKNIDDIIAIEEEELGKIRDDFYNKVLEDEDIKKHLCKIFNLPESSLNNLLVINGATPIDDFPEDEE